MTDNQYNIDKMHIVDGLKQLGIKLSDLYSTSVQIEINANASVKNSTVKITEIVK